ncbi:MAG: hypothetical protein PVI50_01310 [Gammaproteobacteria bacterium]|jgi:hypothetical protein
MYQHSKYRAQAQDLAVSKVVIGFLAMPLVVMFAIGGAMLAAG